MDATARPFQTDLDNEIGKQVTQDFPEIPAEELSDDLWQVVFSGKWEHTENILRTEARALVFALRHKLRKLSGLKCKHLALVDTLPLALAAGKGRASSWHLLRPLRQICSLLLCSSCRLITRWVPSELNAADAPSRGWGR